jgi:uncharacterized protein (DUF2345 family)
MDTGLGFIQPLFFIGVVENREDPRTEGRVQVRAFGVHGSNQDVPTEDLPWATLIIGSHDVNFTIPPLNAWVFGFFVDGRDAQQPMILGLIPAQVTAVVDPATTGWGAIPTENYDRQSQGSRPRDLGLSPMSRLATGEFLNETYNETLETSRVKNIEIAGGSIQNHTSIGNGNSWGRDISETSQAPANRTALPGANEESIYNGLRRRGLSDPASRGIIANMVAESGLDSGINEISTTVAGSRGGFGLIQWTGPRRRALESAAQSRGVPVSNVDFQLDYLVHELETTESRSRRSLEAATDPIQAARIFSEQNLRPGIPNMGKRIAEAQRLATINFGDETRFDIPSAAQEGANDTYGGYMGDTSGSANTTDTTSWEEPASAYAAQYPYNRVIETASGHSIELDDTPNAERIMIWHQNGSYIQIGATATTNKNTSDTYDIHERNHHVYIKGNNIVTIDGDCHMLVKGNKVEEIQGDYKQIVHGNIMIGGAGKLELNAADRTDIRSASVAIEANVENFQVRAAKNIIMQSSESFNAKSKNVRVGGDFTSIVGEKGVYMESSDSLHLKAKGNVFLNPEQNLYLNSSKGTISLQASGNLRINSGAAVVVKSESFVSIKAKANMILESDATININSSGLVSLKSATLYLDAGTGSIQANAGDEVRLTSENNLHISGAIVYIDDIVRMAEGGASPAVMKQQLDAPDFNYDPTATGEQANTAEQPTEATTSEKDGIDVPPIRSVITPDQTGFA